MVHHRMYPRIVAERKRKRALTAAASGYEKSPLCHTTGTVLGVLNPIWAWRRQATGACRPVLQRLFGLSDLPSPKVSKTTLFNP